MLSFVSNKNLPLGDIAQLVARLNGIQKVRGSTPLISTKGFISELFVTANFVALVVWFEEEKKKGSD